MRRVVVTGLGIVSSIGNNCGEVLQSLRASRSGARVMPELREHGYRCHVCAPVIDFDASRLRRRSLQTMSRVAQLATAAALEAVEDAGWTDADLQSDRCSCVMGSAFGGSSEVSRAEQLMEQGVAHSRAGAASLVRIMNSTASGNIASYFGIQGRAYSLSAACATGLYDIGHAYELIKHGLADRCLCGAADENAWRIAATTDNTRGMPHEFNERPEEACRPYDRDRQGFVLAEGAAALTLETWDSAQRRGRETYSEIVGYAAANDGADILRFQPTGVGLTAAMESALREAEGHGLTAVDYVNPHGTGTVVGDPVDVKVVRQLLGRPMMSSTKGLAGHAMGAAAAVEAVCTQLMIRHGFVAPTANLDNIASDCQGVDHVTELREVQIDSALCFNAGLGGTNAALIFRRKS